MTHKKYDTRSICRNVGLGCHVFIEHDNSRIARTWNTPALPLASRRAHVLSASHTPGHPICSATPMIGDRRQQRPVSRRQALRHVCCVLRQAA